MLRSKCVAHITGMANMSVSDIAFTRDDKWIVIASNHVLTHFAPFGSTIQPVAADSFDKRDIVADVAIASMEIIGPCQRLDSIWEQSTTSDDKRLLDCGLLSNSTFVGSNQPPILIGLERRPTLAARTCRRFIGIDTR